ncbi:MAG TPA: protein-disulfide reductase DsbD domain-containing protein, partial [Thermoanaerobaculia bacterium]|nr:protein-disulfide reductase DsbD domain-containing protein [Thermoanaerobaculia bacterium]
PLAGEGQVHEGKTIVTARLIADTIRVQPGKPFTAGVHLDVAPGWHVYWENPGDTALPIQVQWDLPPETRVSSLRWPRPETYQESGGSVTVFGYERETVLLAAVTPPRSMNDSALDLKAKASWLVCEKICIPGEASLALSLPVGPSAASGDANVIRRFEAMVPTSGDAAGVRIVSAHAKRSNDQWRFTIVLDAGARAIARFHPRAIPGFAIEHGGIAVEGSRVRFTALADEPGARPVRVSGVVVTNRGSFDVTAKVAEGEPKSSPAATSAERSPPAAPAQTATAPAHSSPASALPPPVQKQSDDWLDRILPGSESSQPLSLPWLLLLSAIGGLLLNIMPCVLPVISLKVLSFVHQAGHGSQQTRLFGLAFAAGVLGSFWILAAVVAIVRATAEQIGWGFQFQSPYFVVAMSVVVVFFAMNLFGVFEISGPTLTRPAASSGRASGAFLHGMLATVLATPCSAPFLGTAIGFAFTQPLPFLFLAFTAVAAGLALPYVVLSWNPGWLRWVPRPGMWMVRFKQAMGFVLLGTAVWLLSILGSQLGPEGVVWSLVFLTIVAFAVWVFAESRAATRIATRVLWRTGAIALVAGGYFWTLESELRWREPAVAIAEAEAGGGIDWQPFSLAGLRSRVERGETVFIDFTADWCWSCKVNERTVLSTSRVESAIRELNVTAVKADWTNRNPEITRLLSKFGRVGVPFYVVFPAGRLTEPIALSEIITPASVVDALERAGPSREEANR